MKEGDCCRCSTARKWVLRTLTRCPRSAKAESPADRKSVRPGKGGAGVITADGEKVADGRFERTQPGVFSVDDLADIGMDEGTPVADYGKSDRFTGKIDKVVIFGPAPHIEEA